MSTEWMYMLLFLAVLGVPALGVFAVVISLGPAVRREAERARTDRP